MQKIYLQIVWDEALGNWQGGATRFTILWFSVCGWGEVQSGDNAAPLLLEACPTLTLLPVTSPTSRMQLAPFQLLLCCLSKVHSKSMWALQVAKIWQFLLLPQSLLVFTARSNGVYLPSARTMGCAVWPGVRIAQSQGILPGFYPPHLNVGPSVPPPLPLHLLMWLP